jgi:hypothetical protein
MLFRHVGCVEGSSSLPRVGIGRHLCLAHERAIAGIDGAEEFFCFIVELLVLQIGSNLSMMLRAANGLFCSYSVDMDDKHRASRTHCRMQHRGSHHTRSSGQCPNRQSTCFTMEAIQEASRARAELGEPNDIKPARSSPIASPIPLHHTASTRMPLSPGGRVSHHGTNQQMFGAKRQVPYEVNRYT